jgi:undecaprenyl-diphosphatase
MTILEAIIIAIVEGLTEYLPVSSTGHMIIAAAMLGLEPDHFLKLFTVAIQFGAILSVLVLYWRRFFTGIGIYKNLLFAFLPAVFAGLLFNDFIDSLLGSVLVVGISLFIGGFILLFVDNWFPESDAERESDNNALDNMHWTKALIIGSCQVIAMIPGVSRSAATIIGGLSQGLTRKHAAEFSFLLAMPTMFAATAKSLYDYFKDGHIFTGEQTRLLIIGNIVAFVVAFLAVRVFVSILNKYGFKFFGLYRIFVGALIITLYLLRGDQLTMF